MKRVLLLFLLCVPLVAHASIKSDINSLLDRFFGEEPASESNPEPETPQVTVPPVQIPTNPTPEDLTALREQIMFEEEELGDFESRLRSTEQELWTTKREKTSVQTDLQILDEQIGIASQRLEQYQDSEELYRTLLERLTRQKSALEALLRAEKRTLSRQARQQHLRQEMRGEGEQVSLLSWIFSGQTVSDLLQFRRYADLSQSKSRQQIDDMESARAELSTLERQLATLHARAEDMTLKVAHAKKNLTEFADAKAKLRDRLDVSAEDLERLRTAYREEQVKSTLTLQNLRAGLDVVQKDLAEQGEVVDVPGDSDTDMKPLAFQHPLHIPTTVTASFADSAYAKRFGREHQGVDFFAPQGTEVYAITDGRVAKIATNTGLGYAYLILQHADDTYSLYGHISTAAVGEGDMVSAGQLIAYSGGTPGTPGAGYFTTGPHLHLELYRHGEYVDPLIFLPQE